MGPRDRKDPPTAHRQARARREPSRTGHRVERRPAQTDLVAEAPGNSRPLPDVAAIMPSQASTSTDGLRLAGPRGEVPGGGTVSCESPEKQATGGSTSSSWSRRPRFSVGTSCTAVTLPRLRLLCGAILPPSCSRTPTQTGSGPTPPDSDTTSTSCIAACLCRPRAQSRWTSWSSVARATGRLGIKSLATYRLNGVVLDRGRGAQVGGVRGRHEL